MQTEISSNTNARKAVLDVLGHAGAKALAKLWDEWADKGYIRTAYRINIVILLLATALVTFFIINKGFSTGHLFLLLLFIPQLYLYGQQMKQKINNHKK